MFVANPAPIVAQETVVGVLVAETRNPEPVTTAPAGPIPQAIPKPETINSQSQKSSLVETVSINYEDFTDAFLTCATCLCNYDQTERRPKLLSCSHTVCQLCLQRIVTLPQAQDTGQFRCPICRETHQIPRGGIGQLPPSFLVNQLSDLMQRQRRDVVPKCSKHPAEELLFCETCDSVFCAECKNTTHESSLCHNHTIVPFSIAIKRMSEIVLYKANQCVRNLNKAADNVQREMNQLDSNVDRILDEVNASFQDLSHLLDSRRRELVDSVRKTRDEKRKVLQEQCSIIQSEKAKVEQQCNGLQYQVEVRNITRRITDLNEKLDQTLTLVEPRENAFLRYDSSTEQVLKGIQDALAHFGTLSVSRTFPPLCTAEQVGRASVHLLNHVTVSTIDYNGHKRTTGGDPVEAKLLSLADKLNEADETSDCERVGVAVTDNNDGTYDLAFRPSHSGEYRLQIHIFGRPIRSSPLSVRVSDHHMPSWQLGSTNNNSDVSFNQPVKCVCDPKGNMYVLDTGNGRVLCVSSAGKLLRTISGDALLDRSTVGLALLPGTCTSPSWSLLTLNWRTRTVTEWATDTGNEIRSFSFSEFIEPIDLAVDARHRILVADNGAMKVFVFDHQARPLFSFPVASPSLIVKDNNSVTNSQSSIVSSTPPTTPANRRSATNSNAAQYPITSLGVGMNEDILVARGAAIQLYDNTGKWLRQIHVLEPARSNGQQQVAPLKDTLKKPTPGSKAFVGGLAVDRPNGIVLATVTDKQRTYIAVSQYKGEVKFTMDSFGAKLKRPSGICLTPDRDECLVADLGNNCIKRYQFK